MAKKGPKYSRLILDDNQENPVYIYLDEANAKRARIFMDAYAFEGGLRGSEDEIIIGNKIPRICRFCGRTKPQVTFNSDAHVFPEFMGNKGLLSYFECDTCNSKFSKYEHSLASFIGVSRTIAHIKGKKGVPSHFDFNGLEISMGAKHLEFKFEEGSDSIEIDEVNKGFKLKTIVHSYTPLYAFKALVKIGLCLIKEHELSNFKQTVKFLSKTKSTREYQKGSFNIIQHFFPGPPINLPFALLFTRKAEGALLPQKIIILLFANYQYQVFLPGNKADKNLKAKKVEIPIAPLLIDHRRNEKFGETSFRVRDMSSGKLTEPEPVNLSFTVESIKILDPTSDDIDSDTPA